MSYKIYLLIEGCVRPSSPLFAFLFYFGLIFIFLDYKLFSFVNSPRTSPTWRWLLLFFLNSLVIIICENISVVLLFRLSVDVSWLWILVRLLSDTFHLFLTQLGLSIGGISFRRWKKRSVSLLHSRCSLFTFFISR